MALHVHYDSAPPTDVEPERMHHLDHGSTIHVDPNLGGPFHVNCDGAGVIVVTPGDDGIQHIHHQGSGQVLISPSDGPLHIHYGDDGTLHVHGGGGGGVHVHHGPTGDTMEVVDAPINIHHGGILR